ncbi:MAG: response regulator [Bryobacteraceae bacterium]
MTVSLAQAEAEKTAGGIRKRAMVVDDSRAIRTILAKTLGQLGWAVAEARNGREAIEALQAPEASVDPVALVLVDWNMPEMNGIDFVRQIRLDPRYAGTRLMMVTTETQIEQMQAALEAGANEYVMKPFTREVIEEKLGLLGLR